MGFFGAAPPVFDATVTGSAVVGSTIDSGSGAAIGGGGAGATL
jgi:hypothetical protein